MSSVSSRTRTDAARDFAKLASMLDEISVHLEGLRRALAAEIRN